MERGRLERLDEALGEADREAIAHPAALDPPDTHLEVADFAVAGEAEVGQQFDGGGVRIDVARRIDIAIAGAVGQRDVPRPAGPERGRTGAHAGAFRRDRGREDDRAVVEQVGGEGQVRLAKRAFDDHRAKAAGVDEQVCAETAAIVGDERLDVPPGGQRDLGDCRVEVGHAAASRNLAQVSADEVRVEMIAVAGEEGEIRRGQRCEAIAGEQGGDVEAVGVRDDVMSVAAGVCVEDELQGGVAIELGRERVEITLEPGTVGPAFERDPGLVGGVAARHPFGLGDPEIVEKGLELRSRPLPYPDDADVARFDQGNLGPVRPPMMLEQASRHPPGGSPAKDGDGRRPLHRPRFIFPARRTAPLRPRPARCAAQGGQRRSPGAAP